MKDKIPVIRVVSTYRDSNIKCLHSISWWVTDLMLRDKYIDLNDLNGDILEDKIEEYRLDYE